jgi:hypothetical protein
VDDLIRLTRDFTRRITNQDRQRLGLDLRESGHSRSIQITAPVTLQQFFSGEIDLDTDLTQRFQNAPLMSHIRFSPRPGEPARRQATAILATNDESSTLTFDAQQAAGSDATLEATFTLYGALTLRFRLAPLVAPDRSRWLDLMRRKSGIAFLWTRERWEKPYTIFVVRESFARLYAFSPHGFEAAARMTPDTITALLDWLEDLWFPGRRAAQPALAAEDREATSPEPVNWDQRPTGSDRPARADRVRRAAIPDAPEEQWLETLAPSGAPIETPADAPPDAQESDLAPGDLEW